MRSEQRGSDAQGLDISPPLTGVKIHNIRKRVLRLQRPAVTFTMDKRVLSNSLFLDMGTRGRWSSLPTLQKSWSRKSRGIFPALFIRKFGVENVFVFQLRSSKERLLKTVNFLSENALLLMRECGGRISDTHSKKSCCDHRSSDSKRVRLTCAHRVIHRLFQTPSPHPQNYIICPIKSWKGPFPFTSVPNFGNTLEINLVRPRNPRTTPTKSTINISSAKLGVVRVLPFSQVPTICTPPPPPQKNTL